MSEQYPGGFINKTAPTLNPALGNAAPGVWNMTQVQQAIKSGTWPAYDPYYKYVTLNLHGDGTNGGQNNTFLDSSTNNFTITRNGNTTQGTFSPYGSNWSNYFDGSGDSLQAPSGACVSGTGDFTAECWIFPTTVPGTYNIIGCSDTTNGLTMFGLNANGTIFYGRSLVNVQGTTSNSVTFNSWNHIAISRSSGTLKMFVNGVEGYSATQTYSYASGTARFGTDGGGSALPYTGYISNFRIVQNAALYTSNFTPSTTPLTAIAGTSLLICQSNRFKDSSSNNFAITAYGDTSVQRFSPFAPTTAYSTATIGGSGYFDGNGDYLTIPANTVFRQDQGDWTLEGWFYVTSFATNCCFFSMGAMTSIDNFTAYSTTTGKVGYEAGTGGWAATANYETSANTISLNAWNHIAWVRSSGSLFIYVNGTRLLNQASAAFGVNSNNLLYIGDYFGQATSNAAPHYQCDVRFVKGTALYTGATLTVPTAPLTSVTNTSYLLNYTNAAILDNAMMNDLETVGNAQISTSVKKYGTGSIYFDGSGDWLNASSSPNYGYGSGDFTIEFWAYPTSSSGIQVFLDQRTGSSTSAVPTIYTSSGTIYYYVSGNNRITGGSLSLNQWSHISICRSGTSTKLFINGTQSGSTFTDTTTYLNAPVRVGDGNDGAGPYPYSGYIDDLRITKGVARYTANFTPPTSQLQDQ